MCHYIFSEMGMTLLSAGSERNLCYPGNYYDGKVKFSNKTSIISTKSFTLYLYNTYIAYLQPILAVHNVKLVGVGVEELGMKEFMQGKYFEGGMFAQGNEECTTNYIMHIKLLH